MSTSQNLVVSTWKAVQTMFARHAYTYRGDCLSAANSIVVADGYLLLWACWHDILRSYGDTDPSLLLNRRWCNALAALDVEQGFLFFKECDSLLITTCDDRCKSFSYSDFKHHLRGRYPFAGALLAPVSRMIEAWLLSKEIRHFRLLHQAFSFLSRMNLPDLPQLEQEALAQYLDRESVLQTDGFSDEEGSLISSWFPWKARHLLYEDWQPSHGPGATADCGRDSMKKYHAIGVDSLIRLIDGNLGAEQSALPCSRKTQSRTSKLVLVPKSLGSYRSISAEPAGLMWYQQGMMRRINEMISKCALHRRYTPEDQEPNRQLAWEGSCDGSFATIDLSAASDMVSWSLVRKWFRRTPLALCLAATRSKETVLPTGQVMALKKFAPMGSSLCFPIECIVFAAITESSIKEAGGDPATSRYRVFGDDIVVETRYADHVIRRLVANGFVVNYSKTFASSTSLFRESCGAEYLRGVDVAPIRIPRKFSGLQVGIDYPNRILALIDLANECHKHLPLARRILLEVLIGLQERCPKFSRHGEGKILSPQPTNFQASLRCNLELHQIEQRSGDVRISHYRRGKTCEDVRLFEQLRLTSCRRADETIDVPVHARLGPPGVVKWLFRWSPIDEDHWILK